MKPLTAAEVVTQIEKQLEEKKAAELKEAMSTEAFSEIYAAVPRMLHSNGMIAQVDTGSHPVEDLQMAVKAMRSLGYVVEVLTAPSMVSRVDHVAVRVTVSVCKEIA
jgi:hypothetical protein